MRNLQPLQLFIQALRANDTHQAKADLFRYRRNGAAILPHLNAWESIYWKSGMPDNVAYEFLQNTLTNQERTLLFSTGETYTPNGAVTKLREAVAKGVLQSNDKSDSHVNMVRRNNQRNNNTRSQNNSSNNTSSNRTSDNGSGRRSQSQPNRSNQRRGQQQSTNDKSGKQTKTSSVSIARKLDTGQLIVTMLRNASFVQ